MLNPTLPKAELHVHLESAIWPDTLRKMARAQHKPLPADIFSKDGTHYRLTNFRELHHLYDIVSSVLTTKQTYYDLTYDYLQRLASEHTLYAELFISPDHAQKCGVSFTDQLAASIAAIDQARKDFGIEARLLTVLVRHLGPQKCAHTLEIVLKERHPYLRGITIVGDVEQHPLKEFAPLFDQAATAGLQCSAHIGETHHALELEELKFGLAYLPITRIGHGIRAADDPAIIEKILEKNITLEVCPSSNICLQFCESFETHALHQFIKSGIKFSLNTDDPPLFHTTLGKEYEIGHTQFGLSEEKLKQVTRTAIEGSFAEAELKITLLEKLKRGNFSV